jgi:hypothetical protein
MHTPKFTTIFSSLVRPIVSPETDKYLALANVQELSKLLPAIDVNRNFDLLPVAANAYVSARVNKNDDIIDNESSLAIYQGFINKYINLNHDRKRVVGTILTSQFTEFGSDKLLTEDDIKKTKGPVNVAVGGIVWKVVSENLAAMLEESNDPTSDKFLSISLSFEVGFDEFDIVLFEGNEKNLENGEIITDTDKKNKIIPSLRAMNGSGKYEGKRVARLVKNVIPLGVGFVLSPAADVKGVAVDMDNTAPIILEEGNTGQVQHIVNSAENTNKSSQSSEVTVNQNEATNSTIMVISSIKDLKDEHLTTIKAFDISKLFEDELKKASDKFVADKATLETQAQTAQTKLTEVQAEVAKLTEKLNTATQTIEKFESERVAAAKQVKFNERMASLDNTYELGDAEREVLAKRHIADMSDEVFAELEKELSVLMKEKSKAHKAELAKAEAEKAAALNAQKTQISASTKTTDSVTLDVGTVVAGALDNASKDKQNVPVSTATPSTLKERMLKAFGVDGIKFVDRRSNAEVTR